MNRDELIKKVSEQLKDKKIERGYHFDIEWQIKSALKNAFDENHFKYLVVDKDRYANVFYIRYKSHFMFSLRYTKTKGEYHSGLFESYYNYYYKDFTCGDEEQDFDLKKRIYEIEIKVIDEDEAKENLFKEMTENYKKVVALFGDETSSVLAYFERHKYDLQREVANK